MRHTESRQKSERQTNPQVFERAFSSNRQLYSPRQIQCIQCSLPSVTQLTFLYSHHVFLFLRLVYYVYILQEVSISVSLTY